MKTNDRRLIPVTLHMKKLSGSLHVAANFPVAWMDNSNYMS